MYESLLGDGTSVPKPSKQISSATVKVLHAIATGCRHGFDIMDTTGMPSGTVYPILGRMEDAAYVRSRWEAPKISRAEKRPARRYYQLTSAGRRALEAAIEHYNARSAAGLLYAMRPSGRGTAR